MNDTLTSRVAALLEETGRAHHEAFADSDGEDPEWPLWYANYSRDKLAEQFGLDYTKSKLIYCLMRADIEHRARAPATGWTEFYAQEMVEHCAPSLSPQEDELALYFFDGCPFCDMVRRDIEAMGIDVDLRNIYDDAQHRGDLIAARGRATVPVLRITTPQGEDRWMPESRDIVQYLQRTYGEG
jgi:glutaredoxin